MGVGAGIFRMTNVQARTADSAELKKLLHMNLHQHDQKNVDNFFAQVEHHLNYLSCASGVSYLAVKDDDNFVLVQARVFLTAFAREIPKSHVSLENVRAGYFLLSDLDLDPKKFFADLISTGKMPTPSGNIDFLPTDQGAYSSYHQPFHQDAINEGRRLIALTISGQKRHNLIRQPHIDWELKASSKPFDSLAELMHGYHLGSLFGDSGYVEFLADNLAEVDFSSSINGEKASLAVLLAKGLSPLEVKIGYRVFVQGKVVQREAMNGSEMIWTDKGDLQRGTCDTLIPVGAVLHCVASYAGVAQHQAFIADPSTFQNSQRSVFEVFDPGLKNLKDFVDRAGTKGTNSRELESSISWLFSMLGFRVSHLGNVEQTYNAVDLIVATPSNKFALVECTTGLIKADKIDLLVSRTEAVKLKLKESGSHVPKVIAVMISSRTRQEIKIGAEAAEKIGVLILAREDIDSAIDRTVLLPDPEGTYLEAEQALQNHSNLDKTINGGSL